MQPFRIPFTYRNKRSDGTMSTFIKNNAIEHTVYNINPPRHQRENQLKEKTSSASGPRGAQAA